MELSIIVVNWNCGALLTRAINSILAFPPSMEFEVVVIDNCSTDNSVEMLRSSDSAKLLKDRLRIILNTENRGFGAANNQGFQTTDSPLVLLLNPDTEITAGSIDRLVRAVRADAKIGAAGPRILNTDGSLQISVWRNPPAAWNIILSNLKLYLLLPKKLRGELLLGGHWDHNRARAVPMLGGAAMMVRREVIRTMGGFDERYHMYGEDHEWCLRMSRAGWVIMFEPEAVVFHVGGWSSLQRWTNLEKLRIQLEAFYQFQKDALGRGRLIRNIFAYWLTESAQHHWRRVRKIDAPDVKLAMEIYSEYLWRAVRNSPLR